jgi:hypothetical protein
VPVPRSLFDEFVMHIRTQNAHALPRSPRMLLPGYQIKWCCIMLNEFLPADQSRRVFSNPTHDVLERKRKQMEIATRFFQRMKL